MQDIPRASIRELAHKIKGYKAPRFAFFLGAGASKQSGIPTASDMVRYFKEQIIAHSCPDDLKSDDEKTKWLAGQDWYEMEVSEYCKYFERFEPKELGRQRYIESLLDKRTPSSGYAVLAKLIKSGLINTIITTNFDDLVYRACMDSGVHPVLRAYGVNAFPSMSLIGQHPNILKLHGDYLFSALKNTASELSTQDPNMEREVGQVLNEYGLIVVGYSGGDISVMQLLTEMSERNDIYWCVPRGEKVHKAVENLLWNKRGFLIEIESFDEMMNEISRIVDVKTGEDKIEAGTYAFQVALSYAGEDREVTERFANLLSSRGISFFYDGHQRAGLWGKDLYQHLQSVYRDSSEFCVIFLSKFYAQKLWTRHELKQAQARAFRENREYILPIRLDDTEIPGINETIGYLDIRQITLEEVADLLEEKLSHRHDN